MDLLDVRSLPFLTRRNYVQEFKQIIPWSVLAGLVEGQFASVIVSKTFDGSELMIAIASATPVAALMSSLVWGMLCIGRPKIRLAVLFSAGATICAGTIGAIPQSPAGAIWFICQMAAAQVLLAGVVTVRTAFWKSNFPREVRGRITARLQAARFVISVATVLAASALCDQDSSSYRFIYPVAAVFGTVGIWLFGGIRIRGERSELRRSRRTSENGSWSGMVEPFNITALLSPKHVLRNMVGVLRADDRFRRYCVAQLMTGISNLMTISVIVLVVTRDLDLGARSEFWISTVLIMALPRLVMLGTLSRWGRLFDRIGVIRFRVINVQCWTVSLIFGMVATVVTVSSPEFGGRAFLIAVGFFTLRAIFQGMGYGGAALAWQLGHLHFAKPEQAEIYMGIHVFLTGLRGLVAPLGGMWLWQGCIRWSFPVWIPWSVAIALSLLSLALFAAMAKDESQRDLQTPHVSSR
ncbi:MAG: MFS transporter [Planctomycetes bacterium]|nr:MFS transporter [Planctomycetota bacterium]